MWGNRSGAGAASCTFWTWWSLIYTLTSASLPLNVHIIWSDHFSSCFSFSVTCVCNHCHRTNQNHRMTMSLMSHLSCVYNAFSSYCFYFSLMTILAMMGLGPGHLVRALFHFVKKLLVVSVAQITLFVSVAQIMLVVWVEYFQLAESHIPLVVCVEYFQLVESQNHFPAQKFW